MSNKQEATYGPIPDGPGRWMTDAELAAQEAEVERLKRGGAELGKIIERQCAMVLDATGQHDWIDEDGDGDWGAIWENLAEMRPTIEGLQEHVRTQTHFVQQWRARAEAAEARLRKVEALADPASYRNGEHVRVVSIQRLRAALAAEPAEPCHPEHKAHPITGGRVGSVVPSGHSGKTWEPCPEPAEVTPPAEQQP